MYTQHSMYLDEMVRLEDHMEEVVVLDDIVDVLDPYISTYIHLCWNKNEHRSSRVSCVPKGADDTGERDPLFFFNRGEGVKEW
jgi:hypothetical protein